MTSQYTSKIPGPGKKRSFLPAPVKAAPPPRSPSPEPESDNPFQIGERVCIGGIKFGTLQYFGETHIATGVWCGVELDEPEGNHDGMVQGHRYFTCEDKHGIFAPVDKVATLEEDIYFEDDYVDTSSEIEEPVITPRKHRQQTESKIVRSRHSQDVVSTKEREPRYQYKSHSGRSSGIRKHGSPDKQIKQASVSASTSNETLSSQTSPVRSRSRNRGEYSRKDVEIINKSSTDGDDVKKQHKPSHIPGISGISRLPKYSSNSSIVKSSSSSEQIKSAITSPITSPLSPEYEKIDDDLCATYTMDNESDNISKGVRVTPEETYSNGISVQLKSDSRQYLNLTFDPETGYAGKNLPDVVASNSPSPDGKEYNRAAYREGGDNSNNTTLDSNCSEILEASRLDDVNLLDINLLGCADEKQKRESLSALSCQFDKLKLSTTPIENRNRQIVNSNNTYTMASQGGESGNYSNSANVTQDMKSSQKFSVDQPVNQDDKGKLIDLETSEQISRCNIDKLETEMDKSLDDVSRKLMMDSGISEMSSSQMTDSMSMTRSHQMENIHACLVRSDMVKSVTDSDRKLMTDSGISERGYNRDVNVGFVTSDVNLGEDLKSGHNKLERPVSLISTTSADTGYVPDTDSECGTKTTNSPEWPERLGDHTSMTESQIIQYQDSFQEEVKHIISAQISVDSDVSGTTHDTETDHETDASDPSNINSSTLKIDIAPELRSNSSHNSEDDRIEADQVIDNVDGVSGDKTLQTSATSQDTNSPSTENSCDVVSVVDKTENQEESADNMADNAGDGTENGKVSSAKTSPKHAAKTDHKKPNIKVTSRLADYINAPAPPPKPKDDAQNKKNFANKKNLDKNKSTDKNVANIQKTESTKKVKIEKEPPKLIKRTPPKSKWGSIMSQIDAHKDDKPPAVKTEVKSKLQEYLSTPAPTSVRKEKPPKKETKPRSVIMHTPKPDYSKVKSRLSVMTAAPKADATPNSRRGSKVDKKNEGSLQGSGVNSTRSSRTDVSSEVNNHGNHNNRTPRSSISTPLTKLAAESRRSSVSSIKSDKSQGSSKVSNNKNIKKPDDKTPGTPNNKRNVKSTIPPVVRTPKKVLPKVNEKSVKKDNSRKPSLIKTPKASNQNRNRTLQNTPGKSSGYGKPTTKEQSGSVSNSFRSTSSKEVTRLESLCEVRTKELNLVKIELKSTTQALDAMTCLIKYLTQELDAFSCPQKTADLKEAQELQKQAQEQIVELQKQKTELEEKLSEITKQHEETLSELTKLQNEMVSEKETHETTVKELKEQHEKSMALQKEKVDMENAKENAKLKENHEKMHHFMKVQSEREIADMKFESQSRLDMLRVKHLEEIQELRNKHDTQMEELHKQHRDKLEDITHRFECIKCSLGDKVETLRRECDELKYRAKQSEEALFRDTDVKVQMALAPYRHLPEEVESLKTVVEMRNEEIMKLRKVNMDLEKQLDELPIAREKIISLQQKIENLDAIVNIKSGHEKQLHEKVQILMTKYAKESKANKRLSMDYEELMYKLAASPDVMTASQESLFKRQISRSPPGSECSSPDLRRKTRSPFDNDDQSPSRRSGRSNGDRKSATDDTLERRINRRSQTFVVDKKNSNSSPNRHLSPNKNGQDSPMSRSLELSDGNQSQLSGVGSELPPSDSTDNELSVSLNELGVAALEDSLVSINSNSPCLSDSDVFESPQKQKRNVVEEDEGAVKVETDV